MARRRGDRQRDRDVAENVIQVANDRDDIGSALNAVINGFSSKRSHLYGDGKAGKRIATLLASAELSIEKVWRDCG